MHTLHTQRMHFITPSQFLHLTTQNIPTSHTAAWIYVTVCDAGMYVCMHAYSPTQPKQHTCGVDSAALGIQHLVQLGCMRYTHYHLCAWRVFFLPLPTTLKRSAVLRQENNALSHVHLSFVVCRVFFLPNLRAHSHQHTYTHTDRNTTDAKSPP
jgi:hypothetical protein